MAKDTVFISYARQNTDFMRNLKSRLEQTGLKVWVDENIKGGTTWDNIIEEALETSDTIIVVLSEASVGSKMVMNEVSYGIEENKRVIPVMVEECKVPFRLRRIQYIDFHSQDFDTGMKGLLKALDREGVSGIKADPIVAPTDIDGPQVVTEFETPKAAPIITPVKTQTEEKKKGIPNWVYAVLALVIIGVAVPFLLPSEEEEPVKNTKEDKSKIAEKGDFGNKSSEQNMAEQNMANQDVVNPSAPEDSTLVNIPSPKEVAWKLAIDNNTVQGYIDYITSNDVNDVERSQAETAMKGIFEDTGYIQYSEKNGNTYFTKVYDIENDSGKPNVGDIIALRSRRNVKAGVYGKPGFSTTYKVGEVNEQMYVKEVIPSGRAYWVKVGYNK